jgi:hypothetical protein
LNSEYAERAHPLLDELTKAMLCLTDARRKTDYDATLGRKASGESRKRSLEELLLARKIVDREQLDKAQKLSSAIGVDLRDAVMQQKLAKPDVVMQAYADSLGLPFLDLASMEPQPDLIAKLPAVMARQHSCAPLLIDDEKVIVASPNPLRPEVEDEVRLRFGVPVRVVLCTPADIHELVNKHYSKEAAAAQIGVTLPGGKTDAEADDGKGKKKKPKLNPAERKKRRQQVVMVSFMLTFMVFALFGSMFPKPTLVQQLGVIKFYLSGAGLGSIAAAIGWFAT